MESQITTSAEFGKLFTEYKPRFVSVAYRYVRDMGAAEDIVSDSFMAFWESKDKLPPDINTKAYILTIVKNRCLNHLRSQLCHAKIEKTIQDTQRRLLQADIHSLSACNPDNLISEEIISIMDHAVSKMPEMTRKVFICSRVEGESYTEIAQQLEIAVTHVNFEMRRALGILREELKDYLPVFYLLLVVYFNS